MSAAVGFLDKNPRPIGELIKGFGNRVVRRRTGAIVRRGSILREALKDFYRPLTRQEAGTILKAAKRFENLTRQKGKKNGALGYAGRYVLEALLELRDFKTGRLEPSYKAIADRAGVSVSTVAVALKRLVAWGFLSVQRRMETTGNLYGPQLRQITNAYCIELPALAARTLRTRPPAPIPDDDRERRRAARDEYERMIGQLPAWQQPVVRADVAGRTMADLLEGIRMARFGGEQPQPSAIRDVGEKSL